MKQTRSSITAGILATDEAVSLRVAARMLGCQEEDVRGYVRGWRIKNGWRFRRADVNGAIERLKQEAKKMEMRNREMVREAGR